MSDDQTPAPGAPPAGTGRRTNRWAYMGRPGWNPPTDACPECTAPSRVLTLGARRVEGAVGPETHTRFRCEHGHAWVLIEISDSRP